MPRAPRLRPHPPLPLPARLPARHALLAPAAAYVFETLRLGASVRDSAQWHDLHSPPEPLLSMELEFGREGDRHKHNDRWTRLAQRRRESVVGEHAGFCDLFVPLDIDDGPAPVLITGPIARTRATAADLLSRWRWLSGRAGHPSDPAFARYVSATLNALLLQGDLFDAFCRMVEIIGELLAGRGDAQALGAEASALRAKVKDARFVDHASEAVRTMVDERTARTWLTGHKLNELIDLGLESPPEHVVIGLVAGRRVAAEGVEEMLAHDALQRACVALARARKNVVCGRVGEHGVVFLSGAGPSPVRARDRLLRLGEDARALARREFGLVLSLGTEAPGRKAPIEVRYEEALGAAESALSRGAAILDGVRGLRATMTPLRRLRDELAEITTGRPELLATTFERYIDVVSAHCGSRLESVRAHLDAGLDGAARAFVRAGLIDERSRLESCDALDRAANDAVSVADVLASYRAAAQGLVAAAQRPARAAQDRSLGRALAFVARRFAEPITLAEVARVAGFTPRHFARVFKARESLTFEAYVRGLRAGRAKQLLDHTDLSVEKVAQLAGFSRRPHLYRVFRKAFGVTPAAFRRRQRQRDK